MYILKNPIDETMLKHVLAGFEMTDTVKRDDLREFIVVHADCVYYFFTTNTGEVLVFLVEDFIESLTYVKNCFTKDIDATIVKLYGAPHPEKNFEARGAVQAATVYQPPEDWEELNKYAVEVPPFYFGFAALVKPNKPESFWEDIKKLNW